MQDNWPNYLQYQRLEKEWEDIENSDLPEIQKVEALEIVWEMQCCLRNILEIN